MYAKMQCLTAAQSPLFATNVFSKHIHKSTACYFSLPHSIAFDNSRTYWDLLHQA